MLSWMVSDGKKVHEIGPDGMFVLAMTSLTMKALEGKSADGYVSGRDFGLATGMAAYIVGTTMGLIHDQFECGLA